MVLTIYQNSFFFCFCLLFPLLSLSLCPPPYLILPSFAPQRGSMLCSSFSCILLSLLPGSFQCGGSGGLVVGGNAFSCLDCLTSRQSIELISFDLDLGSLGIAYISVLVSLPLQAQTQPVFLSPPPPSRQSFLFMFPFSSC